MKTTRFLGAVATAAVVLSRLAPSGYLRVRPVAVRRPGRTNPASGYFSPCGGRRPPWLHEPVRTPRLI